MDLFKPKKKFNPVETPGSTPISGYAPVQHDDRFLPAYGGAAAFLLQKQGPLIDVNWSQRVFVKGDKPVPLTHVARFQRAKGDANWHAMESYYGGLDAFQQHGLGLRDFMQGLVARSEEGQEGLAVWYHVMCAARRDPKGKRKSGRWIGPEAALLAVHSDGSAAIMAGSQCMLRNVAYDARAWWAQLLQLYPGRALYGFEDIPRTPPLHGVAEKWLATVAPDAQADARLDTGSLLVRELITETFTARREMGERLLALQTRYQGELEGESAATQAAQKARDQAQSELGQARSARKAALKQANVLRQHLAQVEQQLKKAGKPGTPFVADGTPSAKPGAAPAGSTKQSGAPPRGNAEHVPAPSAALASLLDDIFA